MKNDEDSDDYEMDLDQDFYNKLVHSEFFDLDGMIFIKGLVKKFDETLDECRQKGMSKTEIEKYLNHIPLEFVSTVSEKQDKYGQDIITAWKQKLANQFPEKKFKIAITEGKDKNLEIYTL